MTTIQDTLAMLTSQIKKLEADNYDLRAYVEMLAYHGVDQLRDIDNPPSHDDLLIIWRTIATDGMAARRWLESKKRTQERKPHDSNRHGN